MSLAITIDNSVVPIANLDGANESCSICLQETPANTPLAGHVVGTDSNGLVHAFHPPCLSRWLEKSNTCPICRVPLSERSVQQEDAQLLPPGRELQCVSATRVFKLVLGCISVAGVAGSIYEGLTYYNDRSDLSALFIGIFAFAGALAFFIASLRCSCE